MLVPHFSNNVCTRHASRVVCGVAVTNEKAQSSERSAMSFVTGAGDSPATADQLIFLRSKKSHQLVSCVIPIKSGMV